MAGAIRIGCSGWSYPGWRNGVFYPPRCPSRDWLSYYALHFDTVEVNATFYRLPAPATVARWAEATPAGFTFAVKVSRYLTHVKRLRDAGKTVETLLERIEPLRRSGKLGPLLWQLPAAFRRDDDRLGSALEQAPRDLRHAFELRHESWLCEPVYALLREHGAALVVADRPGAETLRSCEHTAGFTYVRFHAGRGPRGSYLPGELARWARRIRSWSAEVDVYAYFNNDQEGFAVENALSLAGRLGLPAGPGSVTASRSDGRESASC